jgi:hypothetical protein
MNYNISNQQKLNLRSKIDEFKDMVDNLLDLGMDCSSPPLPGGLVWSDGIEVQLLQSYVVLQDIYRAEAKKVNLFYMAHFYYNEKMSMRQRMEIAAHLENFNYSMFNDEAESYGNSYDGEDYVELTEFQFMYYRNHGAKNASNIAKKQKVKHVLHQFTRRSQRWRTGAVVSAFMGKCNQAVPELLRNTMEFVGHAGY